MTNSSLHASSGGDNSSDTESAPSPSQADSSKSGDSKRADSAAGDAQCSDQDKGQASNGKAPEPSYGELCVKEEKSPESESGSQEEKARVAPYPGCVHPKTEPQDMDMKTGEVQVKMEPEIKEKGEKGDHGEMQRDLHSDNDSSATCSADEDVEAESDRQRCVCFHKHCLHAVMFCEHICILQEQDMSVTDTFCLVPLQNIPHGKAFIAQPSWLGAGVVTQTNPAQHPAAPTEGSCHPIHG